MLDDLNQMAFALGISDISGTAFLGYQIIQWSCIFELAIPAISYAMSEFLAANPPTNHGPPLHSLPGYIGVNLDPGFDVDTAGLTSRIHTQLATVSGTLTRLPKL